MKNVSLKNEVYFHFKNVILKYKQTTKRKDLNMKITILESDKDSGMKFGVCNPEYFVYFYDKWNRIDRKTLDEAKRLFHRICSDWKIDEAKRRNANLY